MGSAIDSLIRLNDAAWVDFDTRAHGRRDVDRLDIDAFDTARSNTLKAGEKCRGIVSQFGIAEANFADAQVDD